MKHMNEDPGSDSRPRPDDDQALDRLLDLAADVEVQPGFTKRVLAAVAAENRVPSGRVLTWRRAAAVAAALVLIVSGWALVNRDRDQQNRRLEDAQIAAADAVVQAIGDLSELDLLALEVNELDSIHDDWFGG